MACQQPVVRLQVTPQNLRWMQSRHRSLAIFRMRACTHVIRVYCGRNAECKNTVMISMWRAAGVQLGRLWRRCDARFDSAPGRAGAHRPPLSLCMRLYMVAAPSASDNNTLGFASPVCMALTLPYRLSLAVPRLCEQVRSQQPACAGSVPWPQPHTSAALTAAQRLFLKQFLMCAMQTASCSSGACPALAAPCLCFDIPPGNSNFTCGQEARSCSPTPSPPADSLSQFPASAPVTGAKGVKIGLAQPTAHRDMHLLDCAWSIRRQARRPASTWEMHGTSRPHDMGQLTLQPSARNLARDTPHHGPITRTQSMHGPRCARVSAVPARPPRRRPGTRGAARATWRLARATSAAGGARPAPATTTATPAWTCRRPGPTSPARSRRGAHAAGSPA